MTKRTIGVLAALLVAAITMTGCAGTGLGNDVFSGAAKTPAPTATATPTPTAILGDKNGDGKLSEFEKQIAAKNAPRDYTLPDGTVVKVDPTVPLPPAVHQAVKDNTASAVRGVFNTNSNGQELHTDMLALQAALTAQTAATGKQFVAMFQMHTADGIMWVGIQSDDGTVKAQHDKDAFYASLKSFSDSRGLEILVFD